MADDFRAYRAVTPPGGIMGALPEEGESWSPEMEYLGRTSDTSFRDKPPYKVAIDPNGAVIENLPKDFYLNRTPGENVADILRRAFENGAFKNSPRLDNLASGGQMLFEMIPGVAEANTEKALERGDYGQATLEALGTIPGGKLVGTALGAAGTKLAMAFGPRIVQGTKRMFGGVERTEEEIAKLLERGLTEEKLLAARAGREAEAEAKKARKLAELQAKGLSANYIQNPLQTRQEGLYSKAEQAFLEFKQPQATVEEYIGFLKQRGVKDSELAHLGLTKMDPKQVLPSKGIQELILQRSPRLNRVEYTGDRVVYKNKEEFHDPDLPGEETVGYREIGYTLPSDQMGKPLLPNRDAFRAMAEEKVRQQVEQDRRAALNLGVEAPIVVMEDIENRVQRWMDRYYVQNAAYQKPEHWPDMANPIFNLRVQDKVSGGKKIFHVAEAQSDLANDIRKWESNDPFIQKPRLEPPRDVPWVNDTQETMDLMAKKIITEAVNSDADFIVLSSPANQIKRWGRGENDRNAEAFEKIYGEWLPGAIDRNAKIAGGGKGTKETLFDGSVKLTDDDVLRLSEDFDYAEILEGLDLDPDDPSSFDAWEFGVPYARKAGENPDFVSSEKRFLKSKANNIEQRLGFDDIQGDPNKVQMLEAQLEKIRGQLMGLDYAEQIYDMIKERAGQVVRYKIPVTPEMRKYVIEHGFSNFAKGGIVDIANYLGWNF